MRNSSDGLGPIEELMFTRYESAEDEERMLKMTKIVFLIVTFL